MTIQGESKDPFIASAGAGTIIIGRRESGIDLDFRPVCIHFDDVIGVTTFRRILASTIDTDLTAGALFVPATPVDTGLILADTSRPTISVYQALRRPIQTGTTDTELTRFTV